MRYFYSNADLPGDAALVGRIDAAARCLHEKLARVDLKQVGVSEYNQRYLGGKLLNPVGNLQVYTYLLSLALEKQGSLKDCVLVDYGGGSGVMSLLAKELGVGRVIYNDIYDVSCRDVALIAGACGIPVDDYVCGDIDDVIAYTDKEQVLVNAICSYDVIEHIYDIEGYLRKLVAFRRGQPFRIAFGSGANIRNPLIRRALERQHVRYERRNREKTFGHKDRDALRSFMDIRREIISAYAPTLPAAAREELAVATRGLMKQDIERRVDEYRVKGSISYRPAHPTNTCDPWTGNWQEHLMNTEDLERILGEHASRVEVLTGYWSHSDRTSRRLVKNAVNVAIRAAGRAGLVLAPYFVLYAEYDAAPNAQASRR